MSREDEIKLIVEDILCEIKGLMVNIDGQPNRDFCTPEKVDNFIDEIEKVIKPEILAITKPQYICSDGESCGDQRFALAHQRTINRMSRTKPREIDEAVIEKMILETVDELLPHDFYEKRITDLAHAIATSDIYKED